MEKVTWKIDTAKTVYELTCLARKDEDDYPYAEWYDYTNEEVVIKSYGELRSDAFGLATFLDEQKGSEDSIRVAMMGLTSYEYEASIIGTMCGRNVSVLLDPKLAPEDFIKRINFTQAKVVLYDQVFEKMMPELQKACPVVEKFICMNSTTENMGESFRSLCDRYAGKKVFQTPDENDVTAILFTSGTTGEAKGVMLTQKNLVSNAAKGEEVFPKDWVRLTNLPLFHIFCLSNDLLFGLVWQGTSAINDSMMHFFQNMKRFRPHTILTVPMIGTAILKTLDRTAAAHPEMDKKAVGVEVTGGRIETIICGGAKMESSVLDRLDEYGVYSNQGYGITECSSRISGDSLRKPTASVGKPLPCVEVKIENGEIVVKGDTVSPGYYKNAEATKESFTEDGWFYTGDLGYMDKEGYLYVTGRKKNLIILSNGENFSPEEIEEKYYLRPIVKDAIVIQEEDKIVAEVLPDSDYIKTVPGVDPEAEIRKIMEEINSELPIARRVHELRIRKEDFKRTTTGKIIR